MDINETPSRSEARWRKHGLVALGAAATLAGAVGIAWAAGVGPAAFGHGRFSPAAAREHVEFGVHQALKRVNASQAQEDQILAIVDAQFDKHQQLAGDRAKLHQQVAAALTGATVDRAALEVIRAEAIQHIDLASRDLVKAVGDIADVLTPAQRQQLAELHKLHFE